MDAPRRILFLCTQNACRSQMAELWARHLHGGRVQAASAGTSPATPHPRMLAAMEEAGVDVSGARSKHVDEVAGQRWDAVYTLCDAAAASCPALPGGPAPEHRPFPDPARAEGDEEEVRRAFREARDAIRAFVAGLA